MDISQEYERIKVLFAGIEEKQLALIDGAIWEAARLKIELDGLQQIVLKTGLIMMRYLMNLEQRVIFLEKIVADLKVQVEGQPLKR